MLLYKVQFSPQKHTKISHFKTQSLQKRRNKKPYGATMRKHLKNLHFITARKSGKDPLGCFSMC